MSNAPIAKVVTLGCARNEVDSDELASTLASAGWEVSPDAETPDVVLVNTCGFIASAKAESVDSILSAGGSGDGRVPVVAVGCMAERYGQELANELPEAAAVIGFDGYQQLPDTLGRILAGETIPSHTPQDRRTLIPLTPTDRVGAATPPGHAAGVAEGQHPFQTDDGTSAPSNRQPSRRRLGGGPSAPLKIASGCDRRCAFCAIPRFRGAFISRKPEDILAEAKWLADRGVSEAILVSENSTSYGKDLGDPRLLEHLLKSLALILPRVRASYLQPAETKPSLLETISDTPNVAPYFDMSFQHASGPLLRRMRRFGDGDSFIAMVDRIRDLAPEAGIRSNVILGFPGETEADVAELLDFLSIARLDAVGVFGYSDEDDTEGLLLPNKVDADEVAARVARVTSAAEYASLDRASERIGNQAVVLIEELDGQTRIGRAEFQGPEDGQTQWAGCGALGDLVPVTILDTDGIDLIAEPCERSH